MADPLISKATDILSRLVGFDTESAKSNLALIDCVAGILEQHAISFLRLPNAEGNKAALLATIGPKVGGGVVLSGHTDVVPVEGQAWTTSPFVLREEDGRLYGRGACDMKGFAACALALVPEFKKLPLKRPIHILLSYDEETTCLGVMDTIARFGRDLPRPGAVIVGEPTEMRVVDAHKGVACFDTVVTGFEVHSSKPQLGVNAINAAARIVLFLEEMQQEMIRRGEPAGRFDPPYTTVQVGTIHGGAARNITAGECRFEWEFRAVPGSARSTAGRRATSPPGNAASNGSSAPCPATTTTRSRTGWPPSPATRCCRRCGRFPPPPRSRRPCGSTCRGWRPSRARRRKPWHCG